MWPLFLLAATTPPPKPREKSAGPDEGRGPATLPRNIVSDAYTPPSLTDSPYMVRRFTPANPIAPELHVTCPRHDCRAAPGVECDRRTRARHRFHFARVEAAARETGTVSPASVERL